MSPDRLTLAVAAFEHWRQGDAIRAQLVGGAKLEDAWGQLDADARKNVEQMADRLRDAHVGVVVFGDMEYPGRLAAQREPPPILFWRGNFGLAESPAVGMCGSRHASDQGLEAARACGREVARHGLTVVSGYAKGVDMETHLGALEADGRTIIVLAEGMLHYRKKKALQEVGAQDDHLLVVSQFPPGQTWNAGAAMTRNGVIAGLGRALVVIEAKDKGGTLDAGMQALRMRRPVLALEFSTGAPAGNAMLFTKGARRIANLGELTRALDAVGEPAEQLSLAGLT